MANSKDRLEFMDYTVGLGKYKGMTFKTIADKDKGYLKWLASKYTGGKIPITNPIHYDALAQAAHIYLGLSDSSEWEDGSAKDDISPTQSPYPRYKVWRVLGGPIHVKELNG